MHAHPLPHSNEQATTLSTAVPCRVWHGYLDYTWMAAIKKLQAAYESKQWPKNFDSGRLQNEATIGY
eukprot:scaffold13281_cov119-Isochrysis_galbana.AAC.5